MPILQLPLPISANTGVVPNIKTMTVSDNLATLTAAGYLNPINLQGYSVGPNDVLHVFYSYTGPTSHSFGIFNVTLSNGVITLVEDTTTNEVTYTSPSIANHIAVFTNTTGNISEDVATAINAGNIQAGLSGTAGTLASFPATAANGSLIVQAVNAGGAFNTTIASGTMGQSSVVTIPDPGTATSKFVLQDGTNTSGSFTTLSGLNLKYGATPVAQVDPASCTITAAAGAVNTATITIQLKDGSGANMTRITPFRVYASSAADGLTLASAASTGFSVASGGMSLANGTAVTTQISAMSSATGACVLSLLDTGKQTSYLVLQLATGVKISAQLTSGSYG